MQYRFRSKLKSQYILESTLVTMALTICTLGLAIFILPKQILRTFINQTAVYDMAGQEIGMLDCNIEIRTSFPRVLMWVLLTVLTLGLGYIVFIYRIVIQTLDHTHISLYNRPAEHRKNSSLTL